MRDERIADAVDQCINYMDVGPGPKFDRLTEYLAALRRKPDWTADDVAEVHLQVTRRLLPGGRATGG